MKKRTAGSKLVGALRTASLAQHATAVTITATHADVSKMAKRHAVRCSPR
jgi:hypothetical protein